MEISVEFQTGELCGSIFVLSQVNNNNNVNVILVLGKKLWIIEYVGIVISNLNAS